MTFTIKSTNAPARIPVRTRGPLAAVFASLALMGCTHDEVGVQSPNFALVDPAQRHPILVSQKPSTMSVHVPRGSSGLSPKARAEVLDFAARFRGSDAGDSRLVILAPSGSDNEVAAMNAVQQIRGLLTDYGFSDSVVSVEAFEANAEASPAIKVSYMRYVAEGPQCGNWPTNVAYNPQNVPMENTGCANQRNLAAMIANPADLLGPRSMTPRSSDRRDVVFDKYTKGDQTASAKNEDGKVSTRSQGN